MNSHPILLVEDNPDDIELTLRAVRRNNLANPVEVATVGEHKPCNEYPPTTAANPWNPR